MLEKSQTHSSQRKIGRFSAIAVSDGILHASYDPFRRIEREDSIRLAGRPDTGDGSVPIEVNAFVIDIDGKRALVDAGSGNTMGPTLGHLPDNLRTAGIDPATIDYVLLTHIHPDHANGLVDAGNGVVFPNATIFVSLVEAAFWIDSDSVASDPDMMQKNRTNARRIFAAYGERVQRVGDGEILPGVFAHLQPGHTPGHTGYLVQSGNESMLFWGDIVHVASIQLPRPDVTLIYDLDQDAAAASRKRVLDWVATDHIPVAGAHLDLPGFGYITRQGTGFGYEVY
jgi:glyoxylase-like metal-dependent hydrolase (beta-lactamase superfamily II)